MKHCVSFPTINSRTNALNHDQLIRYLIDRSQKQLESYRPHDKASLAKYKETYLPAWRHTLLVEYPDRGLLVEPLGTRKTNGYSVQTLALGRTGKGDRINASLITPDQHDYKYLTILVDPLG